MICNLFCTPRAVRNIRESSKYPVITSYSPPSPFSNPPPSASGKGWIYWGFWGKWGKLGVA